MDEPKAMDPDSFVLALQGRVVALEKLVLTLFSLVVEGVSTDDKVELVREMKAKLLAGLQNVERPIGEQADKVWEASIQAYDVMFDNLENKFRRKAVRRG